MTNTPDLKNSYRELVALTQLFLLQEHSIKNKLPTDIQTYHFFRTWAQQSKKEQKAVSHSTSSQSQLNRLSTDTGTIDSPTSTSQVQPIPPRSLPSQPPLPESSLPKKQPEPPNTPAASIPIAKPSPVIKEPSTQNDKNSKPLGFKNFNLEPPTNIPSIDLTDIKPVIEKFLPSNLIREQIPSDHRAQSIKNAWKVELTIPPIVILSFNDQDRHLAFLQNIAQAISLHLAPARVISGPAWEQEKRWNELFRSPELQLMIASDYGLYLLPDLMKHYKEESKTAKHFLNQTPLLLLSDISLYLKESQLKPLLWRAICTEFEASKQRLKNNRS